MILSVFVQGDAKAQPRAKPYSFRGHARMYDPGTAKPWRARISDALASNGPRSPVRSAVRLDVTFYLRRPKSHHRASGALTAKAPKYPTSKPDFDNLTKAVADELTQLSVWQDDAQIVDHAFHKRYADGSQPVGALIEVALVE